VVTKRRQLVAIFLGALAVCATSHADMMPVSPLDAADYRPSPPAYALTSLRPASPSAPFTDSPGVLGLDLLPVGFLPQPAVEAGQTSETRPAQILADRQDSFTLCLYALLGLGLCRSAPFVKRLHFGCIPDWYHTGGPSQIGHSFAISPDGFSSAPVYCFLQPDLTTTDALPQFRWGIVVSLWRQSQFTPSVLASRGPPHV